MLKSRKSKIRIITILFVSILFLILLSNVEISLANGDNNELTVENLKFQFIENSKDRGIINNINSIDLELPSSTWNVTDIKLNFTDIEWVREVVNVEEKGTQDDNFLEKNNMFGLGVQLKLEEAITIFGAYINIRIESPHSGDNIYVKLRGYDSSINAPNSTVYGEVKVNRTISDGWNYQNFSTPITLPKGNFSLVMEGTIQAAAKYYWYCNDTNPKNPGLYRSENSGSGWINGIQGSPFLYKLDQKIIGDFYPSKSNMTAEIEEETYNILDDFLPGSGNLLLSDKNFSPNDIILHIEINNNLSKNLIFNLSYNINLRNEFSSKGYVKINEKEDNIWVISPEIIRYNYNYSIDFEYPTNWYNLNVSKNSKDITADVVFKGNHIYILNESIENGYIWEISAKSPKTPIILDIKAKEFKIGQDLIFFAESPIKEGNFTFILVNSLGTEEDIRIIPATEEEIVYSYTIPSNSHTGNWTAYIYWNDFTDAGVQSQNFTILDAPVIDSGGGNGGGGGGGGTKEISVMEPLSGIFITLAIVASSAGSLTTYQIVKRAKKKRERHMDTLYNKFKDNLSLNYLMISDNKSGLNVYEQFFAGKSLDPSLLSGFLEAIRNFGIELTGEYQKSETVKLEYQNSKILMNESKDFRLILIMSDNPSEAFINSITNLAKEIEKFYGPSLKNFRGGDITMFSGIRRLIEKHLNVTFIYPLRIVERKELKLTRAEKLMIQRAKVIMKQTNLKHFYTTFLMPDQEYDPEKTKTIFNLIDKGIFQPINLSAEKDNNNLKYN
ncbi:MAG: hypothetical protein ACFFHV_20240 [Promethearchaeota archaeon]